MLLTGTNIQPFGEISNYRKTFVITVLQLFCGFGGRANLLNLSRNCSFCEKTFHRNFAEEFDFSWFNYRSLPSTANPILVADASFLHKNGTKTEHFGTYWSGKDGKAIKGLEIHSFAIVDTDSFIAYHLKAFQTRSSIPNGTRMDKYTQDTKSLLPYLPKNLHYVVADGFYAKLKMVIGVIEMGLDLISRLRSDANLKYPEDSKSKSNWKKVDFKDLSQLTQSVDKKYFYGVVYSVRFKRLILLVSTKRQGKTINLFSTDINMDPETLIRYYKSRFQIEFLFRDAKQHTGLTESQTRKSSKIEFHVNMSLSAINIARMQNPPENKFSMASSKQHYFNKSLLNFIESQLGDLAELFKNHPNYKDWLNFAVIHPF